MTARRPGISGSGRAGSVVDDARLSLSDFVAVVVFVVALVVWFAFRDGRS